MGRGLHLSVRERSARAGMHTAGEPCMGLWGTTGDTEGVGGLGGGAYAQRGAVGNTVFGVRNGRFETHHLPTG